MSNEHFCKVICGSHCFHKVKWTGPLIDNGYRECLLSCCWCGFENKEFRKPKHGDFKIKDKIKP